MKDTTTVGNISEAHVLARLVNDGFTVLTPFGDKERYDLAVDHKGLLVKIQVKTGRLKKGSIIFWACNNSARGTSGRKGYKGEADYFGVYCPENNKCYFVRVDDVGETEVRLRVDPCRQKNRIRWASDHQNLILHR